MPLSQNLGPTEFVSRMMNDQLLDGSRTWATLDGLTRINPQQWKHRMNPNLLRSPQRSRGCENRESGFEAFARDPSRLSAPSSARRFVAKPWLSVPAFLLHRLVVRTGTMLALAFGSVVLPAAPACTPAPANLVAWWPADGHAYDILGVRPGVTNGDVKFVPGQIGKAFAFGASGGRVRILEHPATDLSRLSRWTIEGWVRPESINNTPYPTICSEGNKIVTLGLQSGTGRLESWVNNDGSRRLFSTNALAVGAWNHVALVYDGTRRSLYLNGVLDGATNTPSLTDDSSGASIGQSAANDATTFFQGAVDELSLYNAALSSAQIAALHAAGTVGKCFNGTPGLTFILNPATSQDGFLGGTATFTALAAGCPDITYEWLFNGSPVTAPNATGTSSISLSLAPLTFANAGVYTLRATSSCGSATSAPAQLSVPWCSEPATNLVSWWPADGSGLDVVSHHDGAVFGATTYGPGVNGSAFGFNGIDTYVAVPDAPELSPYAGPTAEMSVEAWVKLDQLPEADSVSGQNRRCILAKGGPGQWEYGLSVTTAGTPEFNLWTSAGVTVAGVVGGQIIPGQWHLLVVTLKNGEAVTLYQDGRLVGTTTNFTGSPTDGAAPLYLGRRGDAQFLNGWVDEVALHSRALGADEVAALYSAKDTGRCSGSPSPAPQFVRQPENQTGYVLLGAGLTSFANGTPRPSYQWSKSNATEWVVMANQTNATLTLTNVSTDTEGNYRVAATNPHGTTTSASAYLKVVLHDVLTGGEHFEKGWNGWTSDGAIWQVGAPTSGPGHAFEGTSVLATVLDGPYPPYSETRVSSPPVDLPALVPGEDLQLRIEHWYNYSSYDSGTVQISAFNPANGQWSGWVDLANFSGYSVVWSRAHMDLQPYAGQRIRLSFLHYSTRNCGSCGSEADGWYIDNVEIWKGVPQFHNPERFDLGQGDWAVDQGTWEFGTAGGRGVLSTVLAGGYYAYSSSRAVSPSMDLPGVVPGEELQLRIEHWFDYSSYDSGTVQISTFNPTNSQWGGWVDLATFTGYSVVWSRANMDLQPYAGQRVRLGFLHYSTRNCGSCGSEGDGWSIDSLEIWKGVPQFHNPERFDLGPGDWSVDQGTWEFGTAGGRGVLSTVLAGNYYAYSSSRAVSPAVDLPQTSQGEPLQLCYWESYAYSALDSGTLQISVQDPLTKEWGPWIDLREITGSSAGWNRACVDLSPFAGRRIRAGFLHSSTRNCSSCASEADGWNISGVFIKRGSIALSAISDKSVSELHALSVTGTALGTMPGSCVSFQLIDPPDGAVIDPNTGAFSWTPQECQGPGTYQIAVYLTDFCNNEANDLGFIRVDVNEVNQPPWLLPSAATAYVGRTNRVTLCTGDPDCPPNPLDFSLLGPVPAGMTIDAHTGAITWSPTAAQVGTTNVQVRLCDGGSPNFCVTNTVTVGVTTNEFLLELGPVTTGTVQFRLHGGSTAMDYILQHADDICGCECQTQWRDVGRISPTQMPFLFEQHIDGPRKFFRVREVMRP